jgi:2-polyprenyl-6-methoxyphenol hydroxylase-like FAD-dependent oxidoreductase
VLAAASPERIGSGGVTMLLEIIAEGAPKLAERLRKSSPTTETRTWTGHHGYVREAHGPGWALVGDAGYFTDPIGSHGLTDAFRDAELLARAVIGAHDDASMLDDALVQYQAARDQFGTPLFEVVDRIASHQWDDAEIAHLLLQLSSAMADEVETLAALDQDTAS